MNTFSVWAPKAETVQLMLGDERRPMVPGPGGWWVLTVHEAGPGTDYAFAINGGPPLPDPARRAAWPVPGGGPFGFPLDRPGVDGAGAAVRRRRLRTPRRHLHP